MTGVVFSKTVTAGRVSGGRSTKVFVLRRPKAAPSSMAGKDCNPSSSTCPESERRVHTRRWRVRQPARDEGPCTCRAELPGRQGCGWTASSALTFRAKSAARTTPRLGQLDYARRAREIRARQDGRRLYPFAGGYGHQLHSSSTGARGRARTRPCYCPGFSQTRTCVITPSAGDAGPVPTRSNGSPISPTRRTEVRVPSSRRIQARAHAVSIAGAMTPLKLISGPRCAK